MSMAARSFDGTLFVLSWTDSLWGKFYTGAPWKKRTVASDMKTGPKDPKSTVLAIEEEAIVVAFRKHSLLPLDDCLYALQATIPNLSRSSLHRCL
jgi:hypothetical protein